MNLWIKLIKQDKILKSFVHPLSSVTEENLNESLFFSCSMLDIEKPIILEKHISQLENFNSTKFLKTDFIDITNFDYMFVEII